MVAWTSTIGRDINSLFSLWVVSVAGSDFENEQEHNLKEVRPIETEVEALSTNRCCTILMCAYGTTEWISRHLYLKCHKVPSKHAVRSKPLPSKVLYGVKSFYTYFALKLHAPSNHIPPPPPPNPVLAEGLANTNVHFLITSQCLLVTWLQSQLLVMDLEQIPGLT